MIPYGQEERQTVSPSRVGDTLQSSTTVAGIAVAIAALFPTVEGLDDAVTLRVFGNVFNLIPIALLLCGLFSLAASFSSLRELLDEQTFSANQHAKESFAFLLVSIILLAGIFVLVTLAVVQN